MTKESKIIRGAKEAVAYKHSKQPGYRVHHFVDVKAVRKKLEMTQREFSEAFGFSLDTLKHWESGRRTPERAAQILLKVIERNPNAVLEVTT